MDQDDDTTVYNVAGQMVSAERDAAAGHTQTWTTTLAENYVNFDDVATVPLTPEDTSELALLLELERQRAALLQRTFELSGTSAAATAGSGEAAGDGAVRELLHMMDELQERADRWTRRHCGAAVRTFRASVEEDVLRLRGELDVVRTGNSDAELHAVRARLMSLRKHQRVLARRAHDFLTGRHLVSAARGLAESKDASAADGTHAAGNRGPATVEAVAAPRSALLVDLLQQLVPAFPPRVPPHVLHLRSAAEAAHAAAKEESERLPTAVDAAVAAGDYAHALALWRECEAGVARALDTLREGVVAAARSLCVEEAARLWDLAWSLAAHRSSNTPNQGAAALVSPSSAVSGFGGSSSLAHAASPAGLASSSSVAVVALTHDGEGSEAALTQGVAALQERVDAGIDAVRAAAAAQRSSMEHVRRLIPLHAEALTWAQRAAVAALQEAKAYAFEAAVTAQGTERQALALAAAVGTVLGTATRAIVAEKEAELATAIARLQKAAPAEQQAEVLSAAAAEATLVDVWTVGAELLAAACARGGPPPDAAAAAQSDQWRAAAGRLTERRKEGSSCGCRRH